MELYEVMELQALDMEKKNVFIKMNTALI